MAVRVRVQMKKCSVIDDGWYLWMQYTHMGLKDFLDMVVYMVAVVDLDKGRSDT
jgi:hypothetical protein